MKYESDIELGKTYEDVRTKFMGAATAVCFFEHGCERVTLERVSIHDNRIETEVFDAPRLADVTSGKQATQHKTGGPRPQPGQRGEGMGR